MPLLIPRKTALCISAVSMAVLLASPVSSQQAASPIARYDMDVGTVTGLAALGGGASSGMGAGLSMMFGGGSNKQAHELVLRLGSSRAPAAGAPKADHFMPPVTKLGASVPLLSPKPGTRTDAVPEDLPKDFQRPKGRLLIYWGCGAKAAPGQPVVIDFAKLTAGQVPPDLFAGSMPVDRSVSTGNSRTYGEWPNAETRKLLSADSSLLGEHRVAGNYAPEIKFALAQDFMPAITGKSAPAPGGATQISWNTVANATGYYAWVMTAKANAKGEFQDMVWWSSSASRQFGGALWDWIAPAQVARLIQQQVVMPPSQTSCTVPAEVTAAGGEFALGNLYAYGPEANFAYPPRPANARTPWKPEWTARVRYRSNSTWLLGGPDMGAMMNGGGEAEPRKKKKKCKGGLGGLLGAVVTGEGC
ncbi:hypothetical protein [Blastomonas sp. AAP53]|uniref:hypothetical protein n=1 Tax=Blastomonas sp. AAP53 TaxID=1248760 RepID=UPI001266FB3E|nr:hypothetical protein [Blastomonas sp. AAP53]